MNSQLLQEIFAEQLESRQRLSRESGPIILQIAEVIAAAIKRGNKILLMGNGGSAADAQHVAAELVGRFTRERAAWPAVALTTDSSILTAVGNDYGFEAIFARQVEALARPGDVVVGISTSGRSPNILAALQRANELKAVTVGFTGGTGGNLVKLCELCFVAPASKTARIQELHICAWHAICDLVEADLTETHGN
jgi:D-sedoheptulose 7-phosphate isomerase